MSNAQRHETKYFEWLLFSIIPFRVDRTARRQEGERACWGRTPGLFAEPVAVQFKKKFCPAKVKTMLRLLKLEPAPAPQQRRRRRPSSGWKWWRGPVHQNAASSSSPSPYLFTTIVRRHHFTLVKGDLMNRVLGFDGADPSCCTSVEKGAMALAS